MKFKSSLHVNSKEFRCFHKLWRIPQDASLSYSWQPFTKRTTLFTQSAWKHLARQFYFAFPKHRNTPEFLCRVNMTVFASLFSNDMKRQREKLFKCFTFILYLITCIHTEGNADEFLKSNCEVGHQGPLLLFLRLLKGQTVLKDPNTQRKKLYCYVQENNTSFINGSHGNM